MKQTAMQQLLEEVILEREKSISVEFREALDFVITAIETDYKDSENLTETLEEIAQWAIDNRYPKSEFEKVSDAEMYHTIIEKVSKWQQEQDKKCFHPLPYRLSKSDVNYECTLCGKFI